ncbi:hypothetical protein AWM78_10680 [Bacillus subtilis subsp. subtilis]|nr:hypothetical protein AWM78_10680 [Bacillus subtilis subsp. subtilis]
MVARNGEVFLNNFEGVVRSPRRKERMETHEDELSEQLGTLLNSFRLLYACNLRDLLLSNPKRKSPILRKKEAVK